MAEVSPLDRLPPRPEHEAMRITRVTHHCTIAVVVVVLATTGGGLVLLGLSGRLEVRAVTPSELALAIGLMGSLILWHQPSNRIGMLLALTGVLFGVTVLAGGILEYASARGGVPEGLHLPALAWTRLTPALAVPWALFLLWFPDGRFTSRNWKRFFVAATVACLALTAIGYLLAAPNGPLPALSPVARSPAPSGGPLAARGPASLVYLIDTVTLALPLVALVRPCPALPALRRGRPPADQVAGRRRGSRGLRETPSPA